VHYFLFYRENASEMMIELLRTYPEESAGEAKDDATNCIVSFIDRPNVWIMDHLLELGPVRSLKEELIYQVNLLDSSVVLISHPLNCFTQHV
jgi:hypothetical protein